MNELNILRPAQKRRVYDLLIEAGVDVRDWANSSRGAKWAAANPKYCYNWAFVQPGRIVVLNLWHRQLVADGRGISWSENLNGWIRQHSRPGAKAIWRKRVEEFAVAVELAYTEHLPIRVIVNDGIMRQERDRVAKPSSVQRRLLDPLPWAVTKYDARTGVCALRRGVLTKGSVDQFDIPMSEQTAPEKIVTAVTVFIRDPRFRATALQRANGRCEFCFEPGFAMSDGRVFLETHHIVPLSDGGLDSADNVAAICPNHHREAHHGARADDIRDVLLRRVRRLSRE